MATKLPVMIGIWTAEQWTSIRHRGLRCLVVKPPLGHILNHAFPKNQTWPCWIPGLPYGSPWTWRPTPWECLGPTVEAGGCRRGDRVKEVRSTYGATYFLLGCVEVLKWYQGVLFAFRFFLDNFFPNKWLAITMGYWFLAHLRKPRVVLVILILLANHCIWVLEQPRQSLLAHHKRFNWLVNHVCFVARCWFTSLREIIMSVQLSPLAFISCS